MKIIFTNRSAFGIFLSMLFGGAVAAEIETPLSWTPKPTVLLKGDATFSYEVLAQSTPAAKPAAKTSKSSTTTATPTAQTRLPSMEQLNQLKKANDYDQIVKLLAPLEYDFAGSSAYDRIYGEALFKKGDYDGASLALERVTSVTPQDVGSHLLLADVYEKQGSTDRTEDELRLADKYASTPADKALITKWLSRLLTRNAYGLGRHQLGGSVEGRFGWTNNANYGLDFRQYNVPGFDPANQTVDVGSDMERKSDIYYQLTAEGHYKFKFTPRWFAGVSLGGDKLKNRRVGDGTTNYGLLFGKLDAGYLGNNYSITASGSATGYYLYGNNRRSNINTYGVYGAWSPRTFTQWDFYGQTSQFRYTNNDTYFWNSDYNNDRSILGTRYGQIFGASKAHYASAGINGGWDTAKHNRPDGDSVFLGTDLSYGYSFASAWWLRNFYVRGSFTWERFNSRDEFFLTKRRQTLGSTTTGLVFKPSLSSRWSFIPEVGYQNNDTNITYRKYSRWDVGLRVRWDRDLYWN